MSGWQRAGDIPGLFPAGSAPPSISHPGAPAGMAGSYSGGPLSIDFGILEFTWRTLVLRGRSGLHHPGTVGSGRVPQMDCAVRARAGTSELQLRGQAMTIVPWFFGFVVLMIGVGLIGARCSAT